MITGGERLGAQADEVAGCVVHAPVVTKTIAALATMALLPLITMPPQN
jgi:hypothetical protein